MSDTFYFTGTRSQLITMTDKLDEKPEHRTDELTFKIVITEVKEEDKKASK